MAMQLSPLRKGICQVLPALNSGGVERGTLDMAEAILTCGYDSHIVSSGGRLLTDLPSSVHHHLLPAQSKNTLTIIKNVFRLEKLIKSQNIHLLHARSRAPAWSCFLTARKLQIPFVTTYHGTYNAASPFKNFYNAVMARGHRIIAISNFIQNHILTHHPFVKPENIRIIHRGFDENFFSPERISPQERLDLRVSWGASEKTQVILLPGRFARWKGQHVLLQALAHPQLRGLNDVKVVLMGDAPAHSRYFLELKEMVKLEGLENRVIFSPHLKEMATAFAAADFVVSASTDPEAFGRVMAEAHAMQRLVLASNHGGATEIIVPQETGWLTPPGDALSLAQALSEAIHLPQHERLRREHLAQKRALSFFTLSLMAQKTTDVYAELL